MAFDDGIAQRKVRCSKAFAPRFGRSAYAASVKADMICCFNMHEFALV